MSLECILVKKMWYMYIMEYSVQLSSVTQSWSVAQSCLTLCDPMDCQASLSITNSQSLLKLTSSPPSEWCHPTISSSVEPFSSHLQSLPASGSFPVTQFFTSGGQSIGASASVLPMNIQDWFPLGLTGLISLQSKGLSRVFSNTQFKSINSLVLILVYGPTLTSVHDYWKKS